MADLGLHWAKGYDLKGAQLGEVVTHFDPHTRTGLIEYITRRPCKKSPRIIVKVLATDSGR
jgi:hypothetical protein